MTRILEEKVPKMFSWSYIVFTLTNVGRSPQTLKFSTLFLLFFFAFLRVLFLTLTGLFCISFWGRASNHKRFKLALPYFVSPSSCAGAAKAADCWSVDDG
ncbi:hypothetical protein BJ742DRAFT_59944 [Cladochytrium replicatum]|nr:hypothetical protein BJ742DRAFT_59944 [Cladochytrium replicatum]